MSFNTLLLLPDDTEFEDWFESRYGRSTRYSPAEIWDWIYRSSTVNLTDYLVQLGDA
jgi:hypothetical protein